MPSAFTPTTNEQFAAMMEMQDLGGMEKEMAQQQALSTALRGNALQPSAGKDWASQLARGLQGGMAGYSMKQGKGMIDKYGLAKKDALTKARAALMGEDPNVAQTGLMTP